MKTIYSIAIVLTIVFSVVIVKYVRSYNSVDFEIWMQEFLSDPATYNYAYTDALRTELREITFQAGLISLAFLGFFAITFGLTLKTIKRKTAKIISIIGLSISGLVLLLTIMRPVAESGAASWNEFGPFLLIVVIILLALCIVNLIQAFRNGKAMPIGNPQLSL